MFEIIAGQREEYRFEVESVLAESDLPGHVSVVAVREVDTATYAEDELSDTELLAVAAEDAMDAVNRGEVAGAGALDELALRRVRRARRRAVAGVLRGEGAIA